MTLNIFCRYALLGDQLALEENVEILISDEGKIEKISINVQKDASSFNYHFEHHLLIPKFINSHTHLGDAIIKDVACNSSLDEAVGPNGLKYRVKSFLCKIGIFSILFHGGGFIMQI